MNRNPKQDEGLKKRKSFKKNDPRINKNGRPKVPKTVKEFIKGLEHENDEIKIPVEACEIKTIGGQQYYVLKSSSGHKLAMTAYNKALKGDIRYLDWLTKMGYAGGYEATKQDITNKNYTFGSDLND
jgi:hypothetical protein